MEYASVYFMGLIPFVETALAGSVYAQQKDLSDGKYARKELRGLVSKKQ